MECRDSPGIASTTKELYHYRIGHASLSTVWTIEHMLSSVESAKRQKELSIKTRYSIRLHEYFDYKIIIAMHQLLVVAILEGRKDIYKQYVKELKAFKPNQYIDTILKNELPKWKYWGFKYILPNSYYVSKWLLKGVKYK